MKRPPVNGAEQDAFSRWRHVLSWRSGELRRIKRRASKRERRTAKTAIKREQGEAQCRLGASVGVEPLPPGRTRDPS